MSVLSPLFFISLELSIVMIISHTGSITTEEAKMTSVITARILNSFDSRQLTRFLAQTKTVNLNIENALFKINWNVMTTVSFENRSMNICFNMIILQAISTIATYLVITCQFDSK